MRSALSGLLVAVLLSGCSYFPDFENTPSARLPVAEVVNQIRCDMYEFLKENPPGKRAFSLDDESYATVELSLSTTAFGDVKFNKIDTLRIDAKGWLAIGSAAQPFPSLGLKQTNQVLTKVQVNISQNKDDLKEKCENGGRYGYADILSSKPEADRVLINQLRVASWLKRTFDSGDRIAGNTDAKFCNAKSVGPKPAKADVTCSVGLDTATLTTKFQIVGDVSGGMLDFAKLIPVVATPTLQINADYYHQIQIIFQGNNVVDKTKVTTTYGQRLVERERIIENQIKMFGIQRNIDCKLPENAELCRIMRKEIEQKTPLPPADRRPASDDAREIARQLRSIRDALILNNIKP